jgi:hypothetical protein
MSDASSAAATKHAAEMTARVSALESAQLCEEQCKLAKTAAKYKYDVSTHLEYLSSSDPDYLSERERAAIRLLQQRHTESKEDGECIARMSVRELAVFLIARKWDPERTLELIRNYWKVRAEHGLLDAEAVTLSALSDGVRTSPYSFAPLGLYDALGRPISYIIMRHYRPKQHTFADQLRLSVFILQRAIQRCHIRNWRRGAVYIEDLAGVGLNNMGGDADKSMKLLENALPIRINKILIVNPNWLFRGLLAIARLFMKKSMMARVHVVATQDLKFYVPESAILREFGGTLELKPENDLLYTSSAPLPEIVL